MRRAGDSIAATTPTRLLSTGGSARVGGSVNLEAGAGRYLQITATMGVSSMRAGNDTRRHNSLVALADQDVLALYIHRQWVWV